MRFLTVISLGFSALICSTAIAEEGTSKTFPVKASQGVAVDGNYFYAISNTKIARHDKKTGAHISDWESDRNNAAFKHFQHMNSATVIDGKLYAAHSRFPIAPNENTVEIFALNDKSITHQSTIKIPSDHGSLTWIDKRNDGTWWMCFAVYGKPENQKTKLVKYAYDNGKFTEQQNWFFPKETIAKWEAMSCSGGSWGADGNLYVTGHDNSVVHVLEIDATNTLKHLRTEPVAGIFGQAIAWDRFTEKPTLWGIVKNKHISLTIFPSPAKPQSREEK